MSVQDETLAPIDWSRIAGAKSAAPGSDLLSRRRREDWQDLLLVGGFVVVFFLLVGLIAYVFRGGRHGENAPHDGNTESDRRSWETEAEREARHRWQEAHKRGDENGMQEARKEMDELAKKRWRVFTPEELKYYEADLLGGRERPKEPKRLEDLYKP